MRISWDDYEKYLGAFYAGQRVIAVDATEGSKFKNGTVYVVAEFVWKKYHCCNRGFWYIGIEGHANGLPYFAPSIFAPIESQFVEIEYSEVMQLEKKITSAN